jgi:hypothetical protein
VTACLAGAGLALFAATRTWAVREAGRAAPLAVRDEPRTGADLVPWLPPLALVGLAGAGALLATRGAARAVVGALIAACGLALIGGAAYPVVQGAPPGWPAATALGGVLLAAGGGFALVRGRRWPAMGARYERRPAGAGTAAAGTAAAGTAAAGTTTAGTAAAGPATAGAVGEGPAGTGRGAGSGTIQAWEALDRGEDPTAD